MAYETNGWTGDAHGPVLFTNVRILDGTGEYPYTGEVTRPGQPHQAGDQAGRRAWSGRMQGTHRHRRHGRDADARPVRRPSASFLEQRAGHRSDPDDAPEEHTLVTAEMAKLVLDAGFTMGRGAPRPNRDSTLSCARSSTRGASPGLAISRRARNHNRRRARQLGAIAHSPRGPQSRPCRFGTGGSAAHGPHADQIRRRFHQAQSLRRGDHRHGRRGDADVGGRSRDGGQGSRAPGTRCSPPTRGRRDRSSNACGTAFRTFITRRSPTKRRSTCSKPTRTSILSRPDSPG